MEIWKDIEGYEGFYQVSNLGRIKSLDRQVRNGVNGFRLQKGQIMSLTTRKTGHRTVVLRKDGVKKTFFVHRLVAQAFISNPNNYDYVLHTIAASDGGSDAVGNLRWGTPQENNVDLSTEIYNNRKKIKELEEENRILKLRIQELEGK